MLRPPRQPRDTNQLAKLILELVTGRAPPAPEPPAKDPAAVERGRLGGLKGGRARAAALTQMRRSEIAELAARARWNQSRVQSP